MEPTANYKFDVEPIAGVDAELVEIGLQYWSLTGVDQYGRLMWTVPAKSIDTRGRGPANVVAAAAVRAVLPDLRCSKCQQELRLRSRSTLETVMTGGEAQCVDCDANLVRRAAALLEPEGEAARQLREDQQRRKRQEQDQQAALIQARTNWRSSQLQVLASAFSPGQLSNDPVPHASVEAELTVLTLLRFAAATSPVPPLHEWHHPFPFHANQDRIHHLINDARSASLIRPDTGTPPEAFVWDPPTLQVAWDLAEGDPSRLQAPTLTGSYYPLKVRWQIPFGPSPDTGRERLDAHLCDRLTLASLTAQRQEDLLRIVHEVLAAEAVRFFNRELERHNLPEVAENHAPRLSDAVDRVVAEYSLGFAYYLAWKAARTAAASAQANPRAPLRNMTTHGVNVFERDAQRALDEAGPAAREFDENSKFPLAATTKTLFYTVLEMDPMRTSLAAARVALPPPAPTVATPANRSTSTTEETSPGFRKGSGTWVEFTGDSQSEVVMRAGLYLRQLEEQVNLHALVLAMNWEAFPLEYADGYLLRLELDGVTAEQLPPEASPTPDVTSATAASDEDCPSAGSEGDRDMPS
ncbi:hypothetical protein Lesp02_31010 [Lentzea sp. NBRC 105346]|uniref:hypothetical protein n=1 Tax=Lentzea sp. NBRC 105346 TaxID=3032205 RepID=UPI0024A03326|nr:hypothetical protein [Lentzea sp. NBRC 105346]GLZ30912.1 hypothetical protein Lesp02_31010 [Lentzea sp. NBRC 105346]